MGTRFDDYRHLLRLVVLFAAAVVVFLIVRAVFMPPGFGTYGHYRAGALDDVRAQPVKYAGQTTCVQCHDDVGELRATGSHARVSCEACHGPMAGHADDPAAVAATRPNARDVCLPCHAYNRSRPKAFPQIVLAEHSEQGACSECHQPHKPNIS